MKNSNNSSLFDELNNRLDDFFADDEAENEKLETAIKSGATSGTPDPLKGLKAIVLEMEWELTDKSLDKYLAEVNRLKAVFSGDKVISIFLKLHNTMGTYLKSKKAAAHPDSMRFVKSLFSSFCRVMENSNLSIREKNSILLGEVNNFKVLKSKIFPGCGGMSPAPANVPPMLTDEIRRYIKETIKAELAKLNR